MNHQRTTISSQLPQLISLLFLRSFAPRTPSAALSLSDLYPPRQLTSSTSLNSVIYHLPPKPSLATHTLLLFPSYAILLPPDLAHRGFSLSQLTCSQSSLPLAYTEKCLYRLHQGLTPHPPYTPKNRLHPYPPDTPISSHAYTASPDKPLVTQSPPYSPGTTYHSTSPHSTTATPPPNAGHLFAPHPDPKPTHSPPETPRFRQRLLFFAYDLPNIL